MKDTEFESAINDAHDALAGELHRDPTSDELEHIESTLFQAWISEQRFDELIAYLQDTYELEGGDAECNLLSEALRKQGDLKRIEALFRGLISTRKKSFWKLWPEAQGGHIGAMKESAKRAAAVMEAFAGLYHGYWSLKHEVGKTNIRNEMLLFQERVKEGH